MYTQLIDINTPSDEEIIWRYMSLDKYIDLLVTKKLFLCRLDKFEDPWEGAWTKEMRKNLSLEDMSEDCINCLRTLFFVNSWHLNPCESAAMWDIYSSKNAGIAIKTTVLKLKDSLVDKNKIHYIGKVDYEYFERGDKIIYFATNPENFSLDRDHKIARMCFNKRRSFEHEKEMRLIELIEPKNNDINLAASSSYADVNLATLIDEIYLSPLMPEWLRKSIIEDSKKFNIDSSLIKKSGLYDPIVY